MKPFPGLMLAALVLLGGVSTRAASKPVMAHYLPWYVAKPFSADWGWHWTMNHFDPDLTNGLGQRQIASQYYPQIGPYDSADPVVLEYHVLLMKLCGIDGVIVDWYGADDFLDYGVNNTRTLAVLEASHRAGLKFALCYEDRTIQEEIDRGFLTVGDAVTHARQTMLYAQTNYFASPDYLRWSNRPVLLNFGPQYFKSNSQWQTIFSVLDTGNQPAFFTEDLRLPVGLGAFNWPPMWLSQTNGGVLSGPALESYLAGFDRDGDGWPAFVSSAFPGFHDMYQEAGLGFTHGFLEDGDGATFRATLTRALTNDSAIVQLVTWNDFGEGTVIEPTEESGYRDLEILQDLRRLHLEPQFPYRAIDLRLARRLYDLRRRHATNAVVSAELDRVFTNVVTGHLVAADRQLNGVESGAPMIYDLILTGGTLQFSVGGFVPPSGVELETSLNPLGGWRTIASFPAGTTLTRYSTSAASADAAVFFRVRIASP